MAVDEAHSVSEWDHDFRPSYLALGKVAGRVVLPPILTLTATATPWVRREIIERLGMQEPRVVVRGTYRPNLHLEVIRLTDPRTQGERGSEIVAPEHVSLLRHALALKDRRGTHGAVSA